MIIKVPIFPFQFDISQVHIPSHLNNPFASSVPEIAKIAAKEFQDFIALNDMEWSYDFQREDGKMFGVLVIRISENTLGYIGAISGKLPGNKRSQQFVQSVFDDATDDFYINKGMKELTKMGKKIKACSDSALIISLKQERRLKSFALQQWLFKHYYFTNTLGIKKNVLEIFQDSSHDNPPAAAGECAAPKLLQYAINQQFQPIALAEFWWGNENKERVHKEFYAACKNKCRPILEFMLNDKELFDKA